MDTFLGLCMMIIMKFSSILYDKTYDETLELLAKSECFLKNYSLQRVQEENQVLDSRVNCEMTRVTARLTQIMAWLLAQKAVLNGEMSSEEARNDKFLLKENEFCMTNSINGQEAEYPLPIRELLIDSLALFKRILILSSQARGKTTLTDQTSRTLN